MRVLLGIAIAVPVASLFCVVYLTALALEAWRDAQRSRQGTPRVSAPADAPAAAAGLPA
jgi:hypothetical protein